MTDNDIEDEVLEEFEKAMQHHGPAPKPEPEPEPAPKPEKQPEKQKESELANLQKRYDFIVEANQRNQRRIRHLIHLLDEMGRRAARLGLRFDEMEALAGD